MTKILMIADLTLDPCDSDGAPNRPVVATVSRLMAFSLKAGGMWFGFIISDAAIPLIVPGMTVSVKLAFLDPEGARDAFPNHASVLFGDGVVSQGLLVITQRVPDQAQ